MHQYYFEICWNLTVDFFFLILLTPNQSWHMADVKNIIEIPLTGQLDVHDDPSRLR